MNNPCECGLLCKIQLQVLDPLRNMKYISSEWTANISTTVRFTITKLARKITKKKEHYQFPLA